MEKLIFTLFITIIAISAPAATIYVDADGTGDYPTIQAAIDDANDGDEIILLPGTYTGHGNRDIEFLGKAITVRSQDPNNRQVVGSTIIDCQQLGRGFFFHNNEGPYSILAGVKIINGKNTSKASSSVSSSMWEPQYPYPSFSGSAIAISSASPVILNCIVANSTNLEDAVYCLKGEPLITGCTITRNESCGIALTECNGTVSNCDINLNYAGIVCYMGNTAINNCRVSCNGRGIFNYAGGDTLTVSNSVSSYNYLEGIYADCNWAVISNCTVFKNGFAYITPGAGIDLKNGIISNCIVYDNYKNRISGTNVDVSFCNIQGGQPGEGNIDVDPCFVSMGYWDTNGISGWHPVDDIFVDGDYHLLPKSLCINAGDPNYVPEPNETDLDDNPRVLYGRIDMGAYEFKWPDLRVKMLLWPRTFSCTLRPKYITVMMYLPRDIEPNDVDDGPPTMYPCDIRSKYQRVYKIGHGRHARTVILAVFNKTEICACLGLGWHRVDVTGLLQSGRYFYGSNILRVKRPRPRPWPFHRFHKRH